MAEGVEYKLLTRGVGAPGETLGPPPTHQPVLNGGANAPAAPLAPGRVQSAPPAAPTAAPAAPLAPTAQAPSTATATYVSGGAAIGIALGSLLVGGVLGWLMRGAAR